MKKCVWLVIAVMAISGCTMRKASPYAISGSRADGNVLMGYDAGLFITPPSTHSMRSIAHQKCKAWGYSNAQAFGGQRKNCKDRECYNYQAEVSFQCLGNLDS